jgi:hypothetical protein
VFDEHPPAERGLRRTPGGVQMGAVRPAGLAGEVGRPPAAARSSQRRSSGRLPAAGRGRVRDRCPATPDGDGNGLGSSSEHP